MVVALARMIVAGDVVGVGLGTPIALVAALVARHTTRHDVHVLAGGALDVTGGVEAHLRDPQDQRNLTPGFVPHLDSMDMAERQAMTLQFLRPAQIDRFGNLNTSRIGVRSAPRARFGGGLATADGPALLPRVIAYHPDHRPRSLPARVDWITGCGRGWAGATRKAAGTVAVVTDLAVIEFVDGRARMKSIHPWSNASTVRENTGFDLSLPEDAPPTPVPTPDELEALDLVDPRRRRDEEVPDRAGRAGRATS
jgi:glutaconate CoA-transferase subunit B